MARIHGSKGEVKIDPTGGSTVVTLASINKWSLDMARDRVKVTSFGDLNHVYVQGLPDVKGSITGFWDSSDPTLFDVALGDVAALLELVPSTLEPTFLFTGLAYLDAKIDVDANGAVTTGGSFVAAGPWTREPVGP
jgi:hypothetical protein